MYDNDEKFERLLYHTKVRWFSRGVCAQWEVMQAILQDVAPALSLPLSEWQNDVYYLADMFEILNASNLQLQGA